jgi:hypothetical protein
LAFGQFVGYPEALQQPAAEVGISTSATEKNGFSGTGKGFSGTGKGLRKNISAGQGHMREQSAREHEITCT